MDATDFVRKWAASKGSERQTSQEHFIDLCRLLGEQTPNEADPLGSSFAFEKGAKTRDGDGFADVWLDGNFAWEYKGKRKDLNTAYGQVQQYREALGNPPLLVVCDLDRYEVHTNWNTETWIYKFRNADIATDEPVAIETIVGTPARDAPEMTAMGVLRALFPKPPESLRPQRTRDEITREAAKMFGEVSDWLRRWDVDDMQIARFITKVMFCMFATDVGLLPKETFSQVLSVHKKSGNAPAFREYLGRLFKIMNRGGKFMMQEIPQFDGGLFKDVDVPDKIDAAQIHVLERLDSLNWADVEPSIFGTLFERILNPDTRSSLGAHYTSRDDMELIVQPVLMDPLLAEWNAIQAEIREVVEKSNPKHGVTETARLRLRTKLIAFHRRLWSIRVLDPACGSGNFLYVSLALLKGLEQQVIAEAKTLGVDLSPKVHPRQLYGIEINPYAHELAAIVVWIGHLQAKRRSGLKLTDEVPVLQPLEQIEHKDAIVQVTKPARPKESTWPTVEVIVGNPPFLGGKRLRTGLGDEYVEKMFAAYDGRVPREADLCCYWFEKARAAIEGSKAGRVGLLATQAIRGGANRRVLERIKETGDIFYAQADRPWVQDGVAVRVSMVGFDDGSERRRLLNEETQGEAKDALIRARPVSSINANLTFEADVTKAQRLRENSGVCFQGPVVVGSFDLAPAEARRMLAEHNPHGKPNSDVIFPVVNASDIARRPSERSIIDFAQMPEHDAALYQAPFEHVRKHVKPGRESNRDDQRRRYWWRHGRAGTELRAASAGLTRVIATPRVAKHRFFVWLPANTVPDSRVFVFARADDFYFGVLSSRVHEAWSLATSSRHGVGNDPTYNNTTCFETFPFPHGTQEQQWTISLAAKDLNDLRDGWLTPEGMIGSKELAKRTLTNLYNERPTWLTNAHRTLDEGVIAAYGWREAPEDLTDSEIVARLLALNFAREPA